MYDIDGTSRALDRGPPEPMPRLVQGDARERKVLDPDRGNPLGRCLTSMAGGNAHGVHDPSISQGSRHAHRGDRSPTRDAMPALFERHRDASALSHREILPRTPRRAAPYDCFDAHEHARPGHPVSLRVAFDSGPLLDPPTGVGRYARELSRSLGEAGITVWPYAIALRGSSDRPMSRWRLPARAVHRSWLRSGIPRADRLVGDVDVVHGTNFVLPPTKLPGVVTIHDLSFLRDDAFPGAASWARMVPWSMQRAQRVVTITEQVAGEIVDHYGIDRSKIVVTHLGVAPAFFGAAPLSDIALHRLGIARPFVLAAGTLEPRKNLPRLVAAWNSIGSEKEGWSLVLAGPKGWGPGLPETPGVVLTGWVGDETLPGLLAAADVFAFPSLYEGFGMPPLEAMATGTACVAGTYAAATEVLGDAALMVDPFDVSAIAGGLVHLMTDEHSRRSFAVAGKARAAAFTWERTARATIAAYEDACGAR